MYPHRVIVPELAIFKIANLGIADCGGWELSISEAPKYLPLSIYLRWILQPTLSSALL